MSSAKDRDFSMSERGREASMIQRSLYIRNCLLYPKTQQEWTLNKITGITFVR